MNSLQKQVNASGLLPHEEFLISFEKTLLKINELAEVELLLKKLQFLGLNFDPFDQNVENECAQIMDQLALREHMKNPYLATNILLTLLDKTEEKINNLKQ